MPDISGSTYQVCDGKCTKSRVTRDGIANCSVCQMQCNPTGMSKLKEPASLVRLLIIPHFVACSMGFVGSLKDGWQGGSLFTLSSMSVCTTLHSCLCHSLLVVGGTALSAWVFMTAQKTVGAPSHV